MSEPGFNRAVHSTTLETLIVSVKSVREQANEVDAWPFRFPKDNEFQKHFSIVMQKISDTLTMLGLTADLQRYPLLKVFQRSDSGYNIRKQELISDLDRTANLLMLRLKVIDLSAFLRVADGQQIAELLKGARTLRSDKLETVAEYLDVSTDTVKAWESGRNFPRNTNISKLAKYIESAFGTGNDPAE